MSARKKKPDPALTLPPDMIAIEHDGKRFTDMADAQAYVYSLPPGVADEVLVIFPNDLKIYFSKFIAHGGDNAIRVVGDKVYF